MHESSTAAGGEQGSDVPRRSARELTEEAARLEQAARQQLRATVEVIDAQLTQLIALYGRACGNVPNLQIEADIRKARSLLAHLKTLPAEGSRQRNC